MADVWIRAENGLGRKLRMGNTMSRLVVQDPPWLSARTYALDGRSCLVGRGPEADLALNLDTVSRRHSLVRHVDDHDEIEDLGSTAGTILNGRRLASRATLHDGDVIELADATLRYEGTLPQTSSAPSGSRSPASRGIQVSTMTRYPTRRWVRQVGGALARFLGVVLFAVGLLAACFPTLVLVLTLFNLFVGEPVEMESPLAQQTALLVAVAIVGVGSGYRLMRGRPKVVLFLRHFGVSEATGALSYAAARAIGGRWRVVTLDKGDAVAVGGPRGARPLAAITTLVVLSVVALATFWGFTGGPESALSTLYDSLLSSSTYDDASDLAETPQEMLEAIFATVMEPIAIGVVAFVLALMAFAVLLLFGVLLLLIGTTSLTAGGLARRAEHAKVATIGSQPEIATACTRLHRHSRRLIAPRLVALRVVDDFWREAVVALSQVSTAVVVDVSQPSPSLEWEVATLTKRGIPMIFIAQKDRFAAWTARSVDEHGLRNHLLDELDRHPVLVYGSGRSEVRHFAHELRTFLDCAKPSPSSRGDLDAATSNPCPVDDPPGEVR